uniref:Mucin-5AC-like n=1 Tax=Saccoglossus kowalevskii TaxID=10224 RepID=A0ABM0MK28_SACKO|nr:PREDICTED: mucin-5AC-like [Saccoglossus kowalevskii]
MGSSVPPELTPEISTTQESTPGETTLSTTTQKYTPTPLCDCDCKWTDWMDDEHGDKVDHLAPGEFELISELRNEYSFCENPEAIECRLNISPHLPYNETGQTLTCDLNHGLVCFHEDQKVRLCYNYEVRFYCCDTSCSCTSIPVTTLESTPGITTSQTPPESTPVITTLPTTPESTSSITTSRMPQESTSVISTPPTTPESTSGLTTSQTPTESTPVITTPTTTSPKSTPGITTSLTPPVSLESSSPPVSTPEISTQAKSTPGESTLSTTTQKYTPTQLCDCDCKWTDWMDDEHGDKVDHLAPGEFELISELRNEYSFCENPEAIECRLNISPHLPYNETGQTLTCDLNHGLVCFHEDQKVRLCYNYEVRFYCCDTSCSCTSIPVTTLESTPGITTSRTPPESTPVITTLPTTPESTSRLTTSRMPQKSTSVITTPPTTPESTSGLTTSQTPPESTPVITTSPTTPESTSSITTPRTPPESTSEITTPPTTPESTSGLTESRTPPESTPLITTPKTTSPIITPGITTSPTPPVSMGSSVPPELTPEISTTQESTPGETTLSTTTQKYTPTPLCDCDCKWTDWMDNEHGDKVDHLALGEFELISELRNEYSFCENPEAIECRLNISPHLPYNETGQTLTCDLNHGLVCFHEDQKVRLCYNYEVRFYCCDTSCSCTSIPVTTLESTPGITTSRTPPESTPVITTLPTTPESTSRLTTSRMPQESTSVITTPPTTPESTSGLTTSQIPTESTPVITTPTTTSPKSTPGITTSLTPPVSLESSSPPVSTPEISTPAKSTPSESTLSTTTQKYTPTPLCDCDCKWTDWMDDEHGDKVDHLAPGEFELISDLRNEYSFCENPEVIECRLNISPHLPYNETGQTLTCDLNHGLVCFHEDQKVRLCYNYEVRFYCCDTSCSCTSIPVTTLESTPVITTPPTTPESTSGLTTSQTIQESTPLITIPPTSPGSTQGTPTPDKSTRPPPKECICYGYGDPHYWSFDGNRFSHQGNCTYILARPQSSRTFEVLIKNFECVLQPGTTCTKEVTVLYDNHVIVLMENFEVDFDGRRLFPPIHLHGVDISRWGLQSVLTIISVGLEVRFEPYFHTFSVTVPYEWYFNDTEGLCGPCNDYSVDDFMIRNKTVVDNVNDFAMSWQENWNDTCEIISPTPCPDEKPTLCDLLYQDPFKACHDNVDPEPYMETCLYDEEYAHCDESGACDSLAFYAYQCSLAGICLEWRNNDVCPYDDCFGEMVYSECAQTCNNSIDVCAMEECSLAPSRGCFCPTGTYDKNGNCCSCDECSVPNPPPCPEGHVLEMTIIDSGKCCPDIHYLCVCAPVCPGPPTCDPDSMLSKVDGPCCPRYECVPRHGSCKPVSGETQIVYIGGCESAVPIKITECDGKCKSGSMWSFESNSLEDTCTCCQATETEYRTVDLVNCDRMNNSTSSFYTYEYILECSCMHCTIHEYEPSYHNIDKN